MLPDLRIIVFQLQKRRITKGYSAEVLEEQVEDEGGEGEERGRVGIAVP